MEWVLNWIADGVVLTALVWIGLRVTSRLNASTRYWIWWATSLAVIGLSAGPWLSASSVHATASTAAHTIPSLLSLSIPMPLPPPLLVKAVILVWWLAVGAAIIRLCVALVALHAMKRTLRPLDESSAQRLAVWQSLCGRGRPVRLMLSERIGVPSVLGLGSAVIVLPEHLLDEVTDQDLDQIIVHEYAHAQRYDDWTGLAQSIVRAFLGFHPAVRWIDRELKLEREVACDDWVVALTGSRTGYARLLTRLVKQSMPPAEVVLAPGIARFPPTISIRVARLLDLRRNRTARVSAWSVIVAGGVFSTAVGIATLLPFSFVAPQPTEAIYAQAPIHRRNPQMRVAAGAPAVPLRRPDVPRRTAGGLVSTPVRPLLLVEAIVAEPEPPVLPTLTATAVDATVPFDVGSFEPDLNRFASRELVGRPLWSGMASAGADIARSGSRVGKATAGYFSRVGSSIASKF